MHNAGSQMREGNYESMVMNQPATGSGIGSTGQSMASVPDNNKMMLAVAPGMSQQSSSLNTLETGTSSGNNVPLAQQRNNAKHNYVKIWEGTLCGQRQGQLVFICKLDSYRPASSSDTLAADWPSTVQIVRLISKEHMNNKQYVGKVDFLVFRALNQHGFLNELQEKKLCAVIQLPTQTLLLSVSDKANRLIGMLFPQDTVVFTPRASSQPQQHPQQRNASQSDQLLPASSMAFGSLLKAASINPPPIQQRMIVDKSRKCKICGDCEHKRRKPN